MLVDIPDHWAPTIAYALEEDAAVIIKNTNIVPAYLFQHKEVWERLHAKENLNPKDTFWRRVMRISPEAGKVLERERLL